MNRIIETANASQPWETPTTGLILPTQQLNRARKAFLEGLPSSFDGKNFLCHFCNQSVGNNRTNLGRHYQGRGQCSAEFKRWQEEREQEEREEQG